MNLSEQKQIMRREVRERLRALSPESVNRSSGKTQDGLMACPEFGSADMVCCYLAVGPEVQTDRIIEACWRQGKKVCVPAFKSDTHSYELAGWEEGAATVAPRSICMEADWVVAEAFTMRSCAERPDAALSA